MSKEFKELRCCISTYAHYVKSPVSFDCGGHACEKCAQKFLKTKRKCNYCESEHVLVDVRTLASTERIDALLRSILSNLNDTLRTEITKTSGIFQDSNTLEEAEQRFTKIENDIDYQIEIRKESLFMELDKIEQKLDRKMEKAFRKNICKSQLDVCKSMIQELTNSGEVNIHKLLGSGNILSGFKNKLEDSYKIGLSSKGAGRIPGNALGSFKKRISVQKKATISHSMLTTDAMVYMKSSNVSAYILNGQIRCLNLNDKSETILTTKWPQAIYADNSNDRLYAIYEHNGSKYMFSTYDANMKLLKEDVLIGPANRMNNMIVESNDTTTTVLISHTGGIQVFKSNIEKSIATIELNKASYLTSDQNSIYTIFSSDGVYWSSKRMQAKWIAVIDKSSFNITNKIELKNTIEPIGIQLDSSSNILTLCFLPGKKGVNPKRYLCCLNRNGDLLNKTELKEFTNFCIGGFISKDEMILSLENSILLTKFY